MTDDPEVPRKLTVSCYNAKSGCLNTIRFMGVKPVRKICPVCLESGTPSDRMNSPGDLTRTVRRLKVDPGRSCYDSEPVYAVTCWPKTPHGGRVMPCRREG